tara:strand:- start:2249 stop:2623 length:375 start_codon:yes stop_codon:yes gene_type:complete
MPADSPAKLKKSNNRSNDRATESVVDRSTREQYRFLDHCMNMQVEMTMFTMSGATFIGLVHQHDRESILFGGRSEKAQKRLIRKDFISLMVPKESIELFIEYRGLGTHRSRKLKKRAEKMPRRK